MSQDCIKQSIGRKGFARQAIRPKSMWLWTLRGDLAYCPFADASPRMPRAAVKSLFTRSTVSMAKAPKNAISPTREEDYPEGYQQVIKAADLAEMSPVRGCMVIKPWGYAIWENIQRVL